ncbi:hypothetical protein D3C78_560900 [compost metagenome]
MCQVLVFQLQARRQQVHHQGIRHALFGADGNVHQHQIAAGQVTEVQQPAVHAQVLAANHQVLATRYRRVLWITGDRQLLVDRLAAFVAQGQRRGQQRPFQLEPRLVVVQFTGFVATAQLRAPVGFRLAQQTTASEEQRITLLCRQIRTGRQLIGQLEQTLFACTLAKIVLLQQRQDQRLIPQRATVVGQPVVRLT